MLKLKLKLIIKVSYGRAENEIEAEVLGPYVRQFDGKWVLIVEGSYVNDALNETKTIDFAEDNKIIFADYFTSRNKDFGVFGVPDSEVYSDNLDHIQGQGKLGNYSRQYTLIDCC